MREPPASTGREGLGHTLEARLTIPEPVRELMDALWSAGHSAYVVGGSLRDDLLERPPADWDLATDARPDQIQAIFPDALYENRFGTVTVRRDGRAYEVTTFRTDVDYADFRRPTRVEFGESIEDDLARRDFTVNALAWGAEAVDGGGLAHAAFVDPHGGMADLRSRTLRAVGAPEARFREDALRMIRAVRLAATLDFRIDDETFAAIRGSSGLAAHLSGERVASELDKLMHAARPSIGLRLMGSSGLLAVVLPELASQRGVPQNKIEGEDLWDHTLRTVDAVPADRPVVRLAALLHDVGKPPTQADGHFYQHEVVGAEVSEDILRRLHTPRAISDRVVHLVRQHMFRYEPEWTDTAIRRFIAKVRLPAIDDLLSLREADNVGSGLSRDAGDLPELRGRIGTETQAGLVLDRNALAVDGDDLMKELGLPPGPELGRLIDRLVERVISDPALNDRETLMDIARTETLTDKSH